MKRFICIFLSACLLCCALAGCGGEKSSSNTSSLAQSSKAVSSGVSKSSSFSASSHITSYNSSSNQSSDITSTEAGKYILKNITVLVPKEYTPEKISGSNEGLRFQLTKNSGIRLLYVKNETVSKSHLDQLIQAIKSSNVETNMSVKTSEMREINNINCGFLERTSSINGADITNITTLVPCQNGAVNIILNASVNEVENYRPLFQQIVNSIKAN